MDTRVARASYCLLVRESDDAFLIERARAGRDDAVRELFERYWPFAWKVAYAVTSRPAVVGIAIAGAAVVGYAARRQLFRAVAVAADAVEEVADAVEDAADAVEDAAEDLADAARARAEGGKTDRDDD